MAKVGVMYKLNPGEPGEDKAREVVEKAAEKLKELGVEIADSKIEPLAFGLYSATILIVVDEDDETLLDKVEDLLKNIDGVNSVENVGMTRL